MDENDKLAPAKPPFEPLKAIGVFLFVFGLVVALAAVEPMPIVDRLIDIGSGAVITASGALAFFLGVRADRNNSTSGQSQGPN